MNSGTKVQFVIIDLSPNGSIDTTALNSLNELLNDYIARGITLCLCNPTPHLMDVFVSSGFVEKVGYENIFVSDHQAVSVCLGRLSGCKLEGEGPAPTVTDFSPEADKEEP
jgi:hypothetical protein